MFQLRDYQEETINDIYSSMRKGNRTIVVQQPPRTGKTVIMSEIARRATAKGNRVLFVVHRKEIVDQATATFKEQNVDMNLAQLGMVQTITRHVNEIPEPQVIFIDEGHHSLAKTYQRIIDAFPNAIKLLFTATPQRTGKKQLDLIADDIVLGKSIKWLTEHGNLAPFTYYSIDDIDRSKLKKNSTGDFTSESMEQAVKKKIYGDVVENYKELAPNKQAVVYCYSVENAIKVAQEFNDNGISAVEVDGTTDPTKRDEIIEDFRQEKIKILTNVNLFTEGLDLPNVDCVIMVRPTTSLALYLQFSMRCLNPREGKVAIIIDHVANWKEFGLPDQDRDWQAAMKTKSGSKRKNTNQTTDSPLQCDHCYAVFYRSELTENKLCPYCGMEVSKKQIEMAVTKAELVEINESKLRVNRLKKIMHNNVMRNVAGKRPSELRTMEEFQAYAKLHHYKPGWAWYAYRKFTKKGR